MIISANSGYWKATWQYNLYFLSCVNDYILSMYLLNVLTLVFPNLIYELNVSNNIPTWSLIWILKNWFLKNLNI